MGWLRDVLDVTGTILGLAGVWGLVRATRILKGRAALIDRANAATERAELAELTAQQYLLSAQAWERRCRDMEQGLH